METSLLATLHALVLCHRWLAFLSLERWRGYHAGHVADAFKLLVKGYYASYYWDRYNSTDLKGDKCSTSSCS
jgi:hypothetical protein